MIAYKVVTVNENKPKSAISDRHSIRYQIGKWTFPTIPKSGIFVFKDKKKAFQFKSHFHAVYKCEVPSLKKIDAICLYTSEKLFMDFWTKRKEFDKDYSNNIMEAPVDSYLAPKVKLIEEVLE